MPGAPVIEKAERVRQAIWVREELADCFERTQHDEHDRHEHERANQKHRRVPNDQSEELADRFAPSAAGRDLVHLRGRHRAEVGHAQ